MALIDVNWRPPEKQLRQFAVAFAVFFTGLSAWLHFGRGVSPATAGFVAGAAVVIGGVGFLRPPLIRPVYVAMMAAALPIGMVLSVVLLTVMYFVILTPIGLLRRALGKDAMHPGFDPSAKSYWVRRKPPAAADRYFRQY